MSDEDEHYCAAVCGRTLEECTAAGGLFGMGGCSHRCPFMARPRCMLEQLAFTNCFSNIDKARYGNQSLTLTWNPYVEQAAPYTPQRQQKTVTLEIPDGHYTIDTLEHGNRMDGWLP